MYLWPSSPQRLHPAPWKCNMRPREHTGSIHSHATSSPEWSLQRAGRPPAAPPVCGPFGHPAPTPLTRGRHSPILHLGNDVIFRILYKCNHLVCDLVRLVFFFPPQHNVLEIHPCCVCVWIVCFFLLPTDIPWCDGSPFAWPFTYCGASVLFPGFGC